MNLKNLVLGIGIVIVFALVLWQGIETFSPTPQWKDFCNETRVTAPQITDEAKAISDSRECQEQYDQAKIPHSKTVFIVSLITAIIVIILGYSILSIEPVGSALIGSGIWAIFWGSAINWNNFSSIWRFLLLFITLILLIWLTIRLNTKKKSPSKKS